MQVYAKNCCKPVGYFEWGGVIAGLIRGILLVGILAGLVACQGGDLPSLGLIRRAIARELQVTQAELGEHLEIEPNSAPTIRVSHVEISQQEILSLEGNWTFHVQGHCDWRERQFPLRPAIVYNQPFELYLRPPKAGKLWQLLHKSLEESEWESLRL